MIGLVELTPAAEEGWWTLFDLAEANTGDWLLIGGQMMFLLAVEHGASLPRATDDVDVVVNVRTMVRGTEWLSDWLLARGFEQDGVSADGIGHRFSRLAEPGPGRVVFDVLAPDWQDAALLLSLMPDPMATAAECGRKDRQRLGPLAPLRDRGHVGWSTLSDEDYRRGTAALAFLVE